MSKNEYSVKFVQSLTSFPEQPDLLAGQNSAQIVPQQLNLLGVSLKRLLAILHPPQTHLHWLASYQNSVVARARQRALLCSTFFGSRGNEKGHGS